MARGVFVARNLLTKVSDGDGGKGGDVILRLCTYRYFNDFTFSTRT